MIGSGLVPLGGDSGEKGDYTDRDPLLGLNGSGHRLGVTVLESLVGETSPCG